MERNGVGMISGKYVANDFLKINLSLSSSSDDWDKAIEIFEDRFRERYFSPINLLIHNPELNGFAIMALNCLLVDTFYQFEEGLEQTNNNRECYVNFLKSHLSSIVASENMAKRFYKDIRCGILHSAQTNNGSMLAFENGRAIEYINGHTSIKVNVKVFSYEMINYFQSYIYRLKSADKKTRENFIRKMHYVCR